MDEKADRENKSLQRELKFFSFNKPLDITKTDNSLLHNEIATLEKILESFKENTMFFVFSLQSTFLFRFLPSKNLNKYFHLEPLVLKMHHLIGRTWDQDWEHIKKCKCT